MKIAILGGGYAGLSGAVFALQAGFLPHVYDPLIGPSASVISTGFLHPYFGKFPIKPPKAESWMESARALFSKVRPFAKAPFEKGRGIFRPAFFPKQAKHFEKLSRKDKNVLYWEQKEALKKVPYLKKPGIYLKDAEHIDSKLYLASLRHFIVQHGGKIFPRFCGDTDSYDAVIIATGSAKNKSVPSYTIKGQLLVLRVPSLFLPFPILSAVHISPGKKAGEYVIGATYEKEYENDLPDEKAEHLLQSVKTYLDLPLDYEIVEKKAAIRKYIEGTKEPFVGKIGKKTWAFVGLGSRGLLFHSYFAKELISKLQADISG